MGNSSYSVKSRTVRANTMGYTTNSISANFPQTEKKVSHSLLDPSGILVREARDSKEHPNTVPIQLYLDVTGSMLHIPQEVLANGLPTIMGTIIQAGVKDATLLYGAIGDHEYDVAPLQVAQFESGDSELDGWLTKTFLEAGGGGNAGESYLLAWYFSAFHTATDAWEKRKQKGFLFTIGDEPCLHNLPHNSIHRIMGDTTAGQADFTAEELLARAMEKNHVFHIDVNHGWNHTTHPSWIELLGPDHLIKVTDHTTISSVIANTIISVLKETTPGNTSTQQDKKEENNEEMLL